MTAVQVTAGVHAGRPVSSVFPVAPLSPAEIRELWAFIHGDIMVGGIRQQLPASLGLCPRQIRGVRGRGSRAVDPRGRSAGRSPTVRRVRAVRRPARPRRRTPARPGARAPPHPGHDPATARTVSHLRRPGTGRREACLRVGYVGSGSVALAGEVTEFRYTTAWFAPTRNLWGTRACPACVRRTTATTVAGGAPRPGPDPAVLCPEHLRAPGAETGVSVPALSAFLADLGERVDGLGRSMRKGALPPTPVQSASWVEALGSFAAWDLPSYVTGPLRTVEP